MFARNSYNLAQSELSQRIMPNGARRTPWPTPFTIIHQVRYVLSVFLVFDVGVEWPTCYATAECGPGDNLEIFGGRRGSYHDQAPDWRVLLEVHELVYSIL